MSKGGRIPVLIVIMAHQNVILMRKKMNDKIKELAKQARIQDHWSVDEQYYLTDYLDEQKFAELIVRECCAILNEMHSWQTMNNQEYSSNWHDAVDQGFDQIKEHFGVEE
jgi:hypothetical protein